jgi:uncharacterized protein YgiM (DUF1202 family)
MKMNCWLILGVMVAGSATAQNNTNTLPSIPPPAVAAPAVVNTPPPAVETNAPAKKVHKHKKHVTARAAASKEAKETISEAANEDVMSAAEYAKAKEKFSEATITLVPGPAEVAVNHVNVRGQAGLKGEVISHVEKGASVTVLGQINLDKHKADEPAQWAKIALPATTTVWVRTSFIDATNKTVLPKKLNLRAGPSEDYSVLGAIDRGTVVTETGSKGEWTKIEAPTNSYAFVAAMYLKQEASGSLPSNPAPSTETMPAPLPVPATETNTVAAAPEPIAPAQPITPEPSTNAAPVITPVPAPMPEPIPAVADTNTPPEMDTNLPVRVVSHEGTVRHVTSLIEPTAYELVDPKTAADIDYLYTTSTNLNIARYNGMHIIVTGEEGLALRWKKTPVLTIQRIEVVE